IFERKMQERQELMDRESIFKDDKWTAPKDYSRARGLLSDIRLAQREVARKKKESDEAEAPTEKVQVAQPPLEMPVPQSPAGGAKPPSPPTAPGGGGGIPARPTVIER
ncbi:MAG: hypothetical protein JWO86_5328, partial [Myxococcaceae bacterium]|nr:hypothetical protein [Myxococcaceae bacterium]